MIRLGLCCMFRDQPIKSPTTTATAIGKMKRPEALAKLSRLCMENAAALSAALQHCVENEIGSFRVNSQVLPSVDELYEQIGRLKMGLEWLKKSGRV